MTCFLYDEFLSKVITEHNQNETLALD